MRDVCDFNTEFIQSDGTPGVTNRVCAPLNPCTLNQYVVKAKTDTSDWECAERAVCNATEYVFDEGVPGSTNRICKPISPCDTDGNPQEFYIEAEATKTSDVVCKPTKTCTDAEYIKV